MTNKKPLIHIQPKKGWRLVDIAELKQYRDLFYFLVARDINIKYKQTVLGGLWAIIQPFFAMVVFTLFFGKLAKIPSDGIPYPVFSYTALVAWTYFANSIAVSGNSLISNTNLISKVYFPRLMIPLSPVFAGLLDFSIAFLVLLGMMFYFHIYPTIKFLILPFLLLIMILSASGTGFFLSALNAKYRDIKFIIPFLIQLWLFASPIVYPASLIPERYRLLYSINPMVGVIEGFRSALLGATTFSPLMFLVSMVVSAMLFSFGLFYFKQMERHLADII